MVVGTGCEPLFIFVDSDLIDRIVGVRPYRPQARTRTVILMFEVIGFEAGTYLKLTHLCVIQL